MLELDYSDQPVFTAAVKIKAVFNFHQVKYNDVLIDGIASALEEYSYDLKVVNFFCLGVSSWCLNLKQKSAYLTIADFELIGEVRGIIYKNLERLKEEDTGCHKMVTLAVLASLSTRDIDSSSDVLENLKSILAVAKNTDIKHSIDWLLNKSILQKYYSRNDDDILNQFEIIHNKIKPIINEWLENSRYVLTYSAIKNIIKTSCQSKIWISTPAVYLGKNQLEELVCEYKNLLDLNSIEKIFLLESSIYHHSNLTLFFAKNCGVDNTFLILKRLLTAKNEKIRLGAVRAVVVLGNEVINKHEISDLIYKMAMEDKSAAIRYHCSTTLAKLYKPKHIEQLKHETKNIRLSLKQFSYRILTLIYSSLLYKPRDIFRSISNEDRAMDILVTFYAAGIDLHEFRRIVRKKVATLWRRRQIISKRAHVLDWILEGRFIGLSIALGWFFTFGLLLILTVKNIYLFDVNIPVKIFILAVIILMAAAIALGIFFGKSASKASFVRHIIFRDHTWYKYILYSPLYRFVLIILAAGTFFLAKDYSHYTVAFSISGLLVFWLMIPVLFHLGPVQK